MVRITITLLEKIAKSPGEYDGDLRRAAFNWGDKKRFDKRVSEPYRKRAEDAFFAIYRWASETSQRRPIPRT